MRVIAGTLRGRIFRTPQGHKTHPMGDKVKGALFNSLGDIEGLKVCDAYSGSGALTFEAISRGAASVVAIDNDTEAAQAITENIRALQLESKAQLVKMNVTSWATNYQGDQFDIMLADPPYDDAKVVVLQKLADLVKPDGVMAISWPSEQDPPQLVSMELLQSKTYAGARLAYYRKHIGI